MHSTAVTTSSTHISGVAMLLVVVVFVAICVAVVLAVRASSRRPPRD